MMNVFLNIARAIELENPLRSSGVGSVSDLIGRITVAIQLLAGGVATVMVLVGAFKILTSGGEPKKYEEGKHTIVYAAIGLAIILLAGGVVSLVASILGEANAPSVDHIELEDMRPFSGIE
ncbi:MAG: hypothetical protein HYZ07_00525 [Candidatus Harrisonbacteria bacterium]|nr:hypothetical protein [Candidatus Harrisonbacteria bacterium]MBI2406626.1 hypothetical protein [Candidatus Harrisonbacteria bacterium]MBI2604037.1 hypothetical protein [Candidatus Harrisonbacteria bacterium]MBI3114427.1 hypothetical protein [Candidatus Harrisonbacteria bacterium]